jgi:hypothetical protein
MLGTDLSHLALSLDRGVVISGRTERAASTLDAAVTADTIMSVSRTASATDAARRKPITSAARASRSPSRCGSRVFQSCKPVAMAWRLHRSR